MIQERIKQINKLVNELQPILQQVINKQNEFEKIVLWENQTPEYKIKWRIDRIAQSGEDRVNRIAKRYFRNNIYNTMKLADKYIWPNWELHSYRDTLLIDLQSL